MCIRDSILDSIQVQAHQVGSLSHGLHNHTDIVAQSVGINISVIIGWSTDSSISDVIHRVDPVQSVGGRSVLDTSSGCLGLGFFPNLNPLRDVSRTKAVLGWTKASAAVASARTAAVNFMFSVVVIALCCFGCMKLCAIH